LDIYHVNSYHQTRYHISYQKFILENIRKLIIVRLVGFLGYYKGVFSLEKNNMISSSQVSVSLPRDNSHSNDKTFVLTKDPNLMYHAKTTPTNLSAIESFDVPSISKNSSFQKLSFSDAVRKQT